MKPKPPTSSGSSTSISISSNPNPNRKPKANNINEEHRRYPLQHLNLKTTRTRTATTSTSTRSGRLRITPGDSLRFRLSHSSSSSSSTCSTTSSKTNNPKLPCISKHKCGPKPISRKKKKKKNKNLTPLLGKIPASTSESATQANDTNSNTPPVQASVSPDLPVILQSTSTSTCYGAGHLFSGTSDKRKCRPKGLLAVHARNANNDDCKDKVPLPVEASMHWLLSPSISISPSHFDFSPPSTCNPSPPSTNSLGSANVIRTPLSDSSSDERLHLPHLTTANAKKHEFHSQLCSVVEALRMSSLSPKTTEPNGDKDNERDSIALSFQFDSPTTSCSSVFLSQIHQIPDDHHQASWNSCSTSGNVSHSQMRISWREGLMSQIDEMDEFDSCRCLSDQEDDANGCPNDVFQLCDASDIATANPTSDQTLTISDCCSAKISDNETQVEGKRQENYPSGPSQLSCSCADSISTDGGGLLASSDSDWVLSYKD